MAEPADHAPTAGAHAAGTQTADARAAGAHAGGAPAGDDLAAAAGAALACGPAALVTILATEGSAPRGAGARLLVTGAGLIGSIGGGALEHRATAQARAILAQPAGTWRVQDYPLGPLLGQCCGGRVRLLIEHLAQSAWLAAIARGEPIETWLTEAGLVRTAGRQAPPAVAARGPLPAAGDRFAEPHDRARRPLLMFGAGHVGRAVAALMPALPFQLAWYDSRPEAAEHDGVMLGDEAALIACASAAAADSAVLILTHDHALDYRLTAAALRSPAPFVGLIGSRTKRARFLARLAADGIDPRRLTCPIGVAGVVGKEPAVIAIAATAQLLAS